MTTQHAETSYYYFGAAFKRTLQMVLVPLEDYRDVPLSFKSMRKFDRRLLATRRTL
jgi:hypothetical protein